MRKHLACVAFVLVAAGAFAAPPETRRVLVLYDECTDLPSDAYLPRLRDYLRAKYADKKMFVGFATTLSA